MNTLRYKGYIGSVGYSEADKVFFGKIEGIDGLVNYEGASVAELTAAFEAAVEDYLVFCEEQGIKPEKSYTGTFNVRIEPDVHREIANRAIAAGISINAFVKKVLNEAVRRPFQNKMVDGYVVTSPDPAILAEPAASYGPAENVTVKVPRRDVELAKTIAERMGWELTDDKR
ncbi:MAG: type II toxin-antitoxin system HicB family antitoxin [Bacteroidales bacterium]|nr:type II toxin-antitoxin system HicB family antitoxin [Bacteroidales bacterium]